MTIYDFLDTVPVHLQLMKYKVWTVLLDMDLDKI